MDTFTALADPTRRAILEMLSVQNELPASAIYEKFDSSHPAISQHLKVLREVELVRVHKRAQQRIYHINPEKLAEIDLWLQHMKQLWQKRFDALDKVLAAEKSHFAKASRDKKKI